MIWGPLRLSLEVASSAALIATVLGVAGGYLLARARFPGVEILALVASLPVALPPTVVGYYLLAVVGADGSLGRSWHHLTGHDIVLTPAGCVIAAAVEAFPFCLRSSRAAFAAVDPRLEAAARTLGLGEWRVAALVSVPLARRGIAAGIALAFARALGDFGATLVIGGNVPTRTRTMTTAVYTALVHGDLHLAGRLSVILLVTALVLLLLVGRLGRVRI